MKINRVIYSVRKYGIKIIIYKLLGAIKLVDRSKIYDVKCSYYKKIVPEDYEKELKEWYAYQGGKESLDNPQTFGGKINWLKVHDATPLKTMLADKYLVRNWIKEKIGEKYLIDLLGVYDSYDEINFDDLPEQFAIKANHGSKMNIIVTDKSKLNYNKVKKETTRWLNTVYGYNGMEIHYFDIPRKILIEKYIAEIKEYLMDYKIHCFNGKPLYVQVIGRTNEIATTKHAFYDLNWKRTDFTHASYSSFEEDIDKPEKLDEMIEVARELSRDFYYVRVDLYLIRDEVKFGEMTFTPANGMMKWVPEQAAYDLGNLIELPLG